MAALPDGETTYVLGLSYSHDASACLLKDGKPCVAIQKERLSRRKHDGNIRELDLDNCVRYCLDTAGIEMSEVDLVVENSPTVMFCRERKWVLGMSGPSALDVLPPERIVQVSHHLAHAYLAYGTSPFETCASLVIDGQGNYYEDLTEDCSSAPLINGDLVDPSSIERQSVYAFTDSGHAMVVRKDFTPVYKSFVRISGVGHLYESVASYVFSSRHDAGKLMGLAPFGQPTHDMVALDDNAAITFNRHWIPEQRHQSHPSPLEFAERFHEYADLAASAQDALERAVVALASWTQEETGCDALAYSGGAALNCPANRALQLAGGFSDVFITPPASDAGISLGCAYYGHLAILGGERCISRYSDYLGREYTESMLRSALDGLQSVRVERHDDVADAVADLIATDRIGGWFQGRSEFGPRALGNRSILANPRSAATRDHLNEHVKRREWFRPYAPSVAAEAATDFFDLGDSPYMLLNAVVREDRRERLGAVTHVDGTARIQTVESRDNPMYHRLLARVGVRTGAPIVLNTSFNGRNEPIVETPLDAVRSFDAMGLDFLALGPYLVQRDTPAGPARAG